MKYKWSGIGDTLWFLLLEITRDPALFVRTEDLSRGKVVFGVLPNFMSDIEKS